MSQATLRHIARRAVQVAILAAGMLAVLLVFSRQAHATAPPSSVRPAAAAPAAPQPANGATGPATGGNSRYI